MRLRLDPLDLAHLRGKILQRRDRRLAQALARKLLHQHLQRLADPAELAAIGADLVEDLRLDLRRRGAAEIDAEQAELIAHDGGEPAPRIDHLRHPAGQRPLAAGRDREFGRGHGHGREHLGHGGSPWKRIWSGQRNAAMIARMSRARRANSVIRGHAASPLLFGRRGGGGPKGEELRGPARPPLRAAPETMARGTPDARFVRSLMRKANKRASQSRRKHRNVRRFAHGEASGLLRALPGGD